MTVEQRSISYLALGSNRGDRLSMLRGAREALRKDPAVTVTLSSPLYETAPVGGPAGQPAYLNAVLRIETGLPPERLLQLCRRIEDDFGRTRETRWGPRTLDIDILFYGDLVRAEPDPVLPHPRLHVRSFVLAPLADLAPGLIHPVVGRTVHELLRRLGATEGVQRVAEMW